MTELLISKGADVNARDNQKNVPLHFVKDIAIEKLFLKHGADVKAKDNSGNTLLHTAKTVAIAKLFLEHGADIHAKNNNGYTPYYKGRLFTYNPNEVKEFLECVVIKQTKDFSVCLPT